MRNTGITWARVAQVAALTVSNMPVSVSVATHRKTGRHPEVTARRQVRRDMRLAAQSETLDQRAVTLDVDVLEVAQEAAALSNEQQQATT